MLNLPESRFINLIRHISTLPILRPPEDIELSAPAIALLAWVSRSPGCGVLDISKGLQLSPPTISVGIRRLVIGGWLERRKDPEDRRARPLFLTSKGEEIMARVRSHRAQMLKGFLSGLSDDEQEQLLRLLERAVEALEESIQEESHRAH